MKKQFKRGAFLKLSLVLTWNFDIPKIFFAMLVFNNLKFYKVMLVVFCMCFRLSFCKSGLFYLPAFLFSFGEVSWQCKSFVSVEAATLGISLDYFKRRCRTSDIIRLGWWAIWWWIKRTSEYWPSVRRYLSTAWKLECRYLRESAAWQYPFARSFTGSCLWFAKFTYGPSEILHFI